MPKTDHTICISRRARSPAANLVFVCIALAVLAWPFATAPAWAQGGVAFSDPTCAANPGAVVNNGSANGGLAVSGAADCPVGTTPSAVVNDANGIAIGNDRTRPTTTAGDGNSIAVGNGAAAGADGVTGAIAVGGGAIASGHQAVAIGRGADALGAGSVAIGADSTSEDENDASLGVLAHAAGGNALSLGALSTAQGDGSTAAGAFSFASAGGATALGSSSFATGESSTALGIGARSTGFDAVALGAGAQSTNSLTIAIGGGAVASEQKGIALGTSSQAVNQESVAIGTVAVASGLRGLAFGSASQASNQNAIAVGTFSVSSGVNSIALGAGAFATGQQSISIGPANIVTGANSGAFGDLNIVLGANSYAFGNNNRIFAPNAFVLGNNVSVASALNGAVALGNGTVVAAPVGTGSILINGTTYTFAGATPQSTVSIGAPGLERTLTNLAAGRLNAGSTDAVNGSQLFAVSQAVDALDGTVANAVLYDDPSASVVTFAGASGTRLTNVTAGALSASSSDAVNGSQLFATNQALGVLDENVGQLTALAVLYNDDTQSAIALGGASGTTISNLAPGALGASSTDAVNGAQLFATASSTATALGGGAAANPDGSITAPTYAVQGGSFNNVGSALGALDTQVTTNTTDITNIENGGTGFIMSDGSALPSVSGPNAAAGGPGAFASGDGALALGAGSRATNQGSIAIGDGALSAGLNSLSIGAGSLALDQRAIAIGTFNTVTSGGAFGRSNLVPGGNSYAIGSNNEVFGFNSFVLGNNVTIPGTINGAVALGNGTTVAAAVGTSGIVINGVNYAFAGATPVSTVSIGSAASPRTLTNLAAGRVSASSTDAINGSQLFATNQALSALDGEFGQLNALAVLYDDDTRSTITFGGVTGTLLTNLTPGMLSASSTDAINGAQLFATASSTATALGGGAAVNPDGSITAPTYAVQGGSFNNVGTALGAIDTQVTTNTTNITNLSSDIASGGIGLVQQASAGADISVGAATDGAQVNFTGTAGPRILTGVAPGALSATSTDAVNGSQLFATNQALAALAGGGAANPLAVLYDDDTFASITLAGASGTTISNLAAGNVSTTSTDAVNGAQLFNTASSTAAALGGGAAVNSDGSITAPTYAVQGGSFNNVGAALGAIDTQVTTNTTAIASLTNDIETGAVGLVRQAAPGADLTVGAETDGAQVDINGTAGARVLTGVAAGAVNADSTDAVNGAQLDRAISDLTQQIDATGPGAFVTAANSPGDAPIATGAGASAGGVNAVASGEASLAVGNGARASGSQSVALGAGSTDDGVDNVVSVGSASNERRVVHVADGVDDTDAATVGQVNAAFDRAVTNANAYTDKRFAVISADMNVVRRDSEAGTAAAMALTGIPQTIRPGTSLVGIGVGSWQGESAIAFGASRSSSDGRVVFRAGGTYNSRSQGGASAGIGVSF